MGSAKIHAEGDKAIIFARSLIGVFPSSVLYKRFKIKVILEVGQVKFFDKTVWLNTVVKMFPPFLFG